MLEHEHRPIMAKSAKMYFIFMAQDYFVTVSKSEYVAG